MYGGFGQKAFNINDYAPTDPMSQIQGYGINQATNVPSSSSAQQQLAPQVNTVPPPERTHSQTSHRREESGVKTPKTESEQQTAKMRSDFRLAPTYIPTPINGTSAVTGQPAVTSKPTENTLPPQQHNNIRHRQQPGAPPNIVVSGQQQQPVMQHSSMQHPEMQQQPPRHPVQQQPQTRGRQQQPQVQPQRLSHQDEEARRQRVTEFRERVDKLIDSFSEEERAHMDKFLDFTGVSDIWCRFKGYTVDCFHICEKFRQYGVPISNDLINRLPDHHPARIHVNGGRRGVQHGQAPGLPVPNIWSPEQVWKMQEEQRRFDANQQQYQIMMAQGGGRVQGSEPNFVQQMTHQNAAQVRGSQEQPQGRGPMPQNMPHRQPQFQPNQMRQMQNANRQVPPSNAFTAQHNLMALGPPPPFISPGAIQQNQVNHPLHPLHPAFQMQLMSQGHAFLHQQQQHHQQGMPLNMQQALRDKCGGPPPLQNFQHPPNYILAQTQQYEMSSQQQRQPLQPPANAANAMLTADQEPPRSDLTPSPSDRASSNTADDVPNTPGDRKPFVDSIRRPEVPESDQKPIVQPIQNPVVRNSEASPKPGPTTGSEKGQKRKKPRKGPIPVITLDDDPLPRVKREIPDDVVSSSSSAVSTSVKQEPATSSSSEPPNGVNMEEIFNRLLEKQSSEIANIKNSLNEQIESLKKTIHDLQAARAASPNQVGVVANEHAQVAVNPETVTTSATINNELPAIQKSDIVVAANQEEVPILQRSRSSSSEAVLPKKRKRRLVCSDEEDDNDVPGPVPVSVPELERDEDVQPENHCSRQERRARPKPHIFNENSDDEMPDARNRRRRAVQSDDEEYQEETSSSASENSVSPAPTDSEDSIADFIVPDYQDSDEKRSSSREDREITRLRKPRRDSNETSGRSARVSREKSHTPKSRKRPDPINGGGSFSTSKPKNIPQTEEQREAERKLRAMKTRKTKEENRERKNQEKIKLMESTPIRRTRGRDKVMPQPQSPNTESLQYAISEFARHHSKHRGSSTQREKSASSEPRKREEAKRAKPDQSHQGSGTGKSSLQKRPTPSDDHSDNYGVHVPSKRLAHSNSVPGPSRIRPSPPVRRPGLSDILTQRDKEQEERAKKDAANIERLKNKKYLTEEEKMLLRAAERKAARSQQEIAQKRTERSVSASSSSASLKVSTSTKRVIVKKEPMEVPERRPDPPKILDPSLGRTFLSLRQKELERIFNTILDAKIADPAAEAQKIELELVTQTPDQKKYPTRVNHKIFEIRRNSASGIIAVNPNAVSHERMLAGHAKENCTVAKSKKSLDFRQLGLDDLHQHIVPFKMTMSELTVNAYPLFKPGSREVVIAETTYTANKKMFLDDHETTRTCSRCSKEFRVNPNGTMISQKDACRYHNRATVCDGKKQTYSKRYNCCNEEVNSSSASLGCKFRDIHVFDQLFKRELGRFVATPKPSSPTDSRSKAAFALDCEMVYTLEGPALARLTMVDMKGTQVLDVFIKPPSTVIDANTEFSGLTLEQVNNAKDDLKSCHNKLFKYVNSETILIGHSLESDLKAMRIVHTSVIDTAVMFAGANNKQALKNLSKKLLQKRIQGDNEDAVGHDSLEDAMTCVNLIFHGLKNPESVPHRKQS